MRLRSKLALGGGLASASGLLGIAVAGMVAGGAVVVTGPAPAAHAENLTTFDDCAELRDWYVDHAVREVGPYGWNGGGWYGYGRDVMFEARMGADAVPLATAATAGGAENGVANSDTGTNTQEAGVDEPDLAKTDGTIVVRLVRGRTVVVSDLSGPAPRELGRVALPGASTYGNELLLAGDHVLVLATDPDPIVRPTSAPTDTIGSRIRWSGALGTRVIDIDIADPAAPEVAHVDRYGGSLVSARLSNGEIRLVTTSTRPQLAFRMPGKNLTKRAATRYNRDLVRATSIEDWLPSVVTNGQRTPLVECADVLHPRVWSGADTVTVTTFAAADIATRASTAITATAQVAYASGNRLYVASTRMPEPTVYEGMTRDLVGPDRTDRTDVHAFALTGGDARYLGSGEIEGTVRDRWSLDEQDGVLRVAWTRWSDRGRTRNGITTLTERDGTLAKAGEIDDLGIEENIQAVRWLDDLAVVVTFRQMDPLYTIDLSDPARPRELGALKIPGYSGYLHPIGEDRLLGLGVDADLEGRFRGSQAATFDLADPGDTRQLDRVSFGRSSLPALDDPRGFTWLPDRGVGITTVSDWNGRGRLIALSVDAAGGLASRTLDASVQGWQTRVLPLADGRVAVVDGDGPASLRVLDLD